MKDDEKTKDKDELGKSGVKKDDKKLSSAVSNKKIRELAEAYMKRKGMTMLHPKLTFDVSPERGAKIAKAYEEMKNEPDSPKVKKAYNALIQETLDQWNEIRKTGLKTTKITPDMGNPYPGGSKDVIKDIAENNHLFYFPTEQGYGSTDQQDANHPMLQKVKVDGQEVPANDIFRIVHDYFGHVKEGHGFGPQGEENAWMTHKQMYSPEAQKALTSETRGQNSWVNFGPLGEQNRKDPSKTTYAEQKAGLMPDWVVDEEPTTGREKMYDGGRVMMQAGGNPGFQLPQGMTEEDLLPSQPSYTPPTAAPVATPVPTQQARPEAPTMAPKASTGFELPAGMTEEDLLGETPTTPSVAREEEAPSEIRITKEGVPMYDLQSGQRRLITVPHAQVVDAVNSRQYALPQGIRLPVINPNGQLGDVPASEFQQALQERYRYVDPHEAATIQYQGVGQQALAFAEGAAEGVLGPLAPMIESGVFGVPKEDIRGRGEVYGKTKTAGEIIGFAAPLILTGGAWAAEKAGLEAAGIGLGKAAEIASKAPLPALATKVGSVVKIPEAGVWITNTPRIFARNALEGLVFSASDQLGEAYLENPDQTANSAMVSMGLGTVLGGVFGVGLSGIMKGASKILGEKVPFKTIGGAGEPLPGAPPRGPNEPPIAPEAPPTSPQEALQRELQKEGVPLAKEYTPETLPPEAAPPPSGVFTRPKIQEDLIPGEPATSQPEFKSEERQMYEEITGQKYTPEEVIPPEEKPSGLYIEEQRRWVAPEDVEAYKARDPVTIDKYHPELNIGEMLGKENLSILQKNARNVVRAKENARQIEAAWVRSSKRQGIENPNPDEIPLDKLTDDPKVHHVLNYLNETSSWAARFFPYSKQKIAFNELQEKNIRALLGEYLGKDAAYFGDEYKTVINQRFARMYEQFKAPFEWMEQFLGKVPISQDVKILKSSLEKTLKEVSEIQSGQRPAFKKVIKDIDQGRFRSLFNLKDYLSQIGKEAKWGSRLDDFSLSDQAIIKGYRDVWVTLKQFEENFISTALDNPAVKSALTPQELATLSQDWAKKKAADAAYKAFADELKKLAEVAGIPKQAAKSVTGTMDYFRTVSPDDFFKSMDIKKLNYNDIKNIQENFGYLAPVMRAAEKQRILQTVYQAKDMSQKNVAIAQLKKIQKDQAKADFLFGSKEGREILEDLIILHNPAEIKNWSNTAYAEGVIRNLGVLGLKTEAATAVGAHTLLKGARETMKLGRGLRGKPKKYAEGGMVEADMPMPPSTQQAFVNAVNRPPEMEEAHRTANAIIKGEKMITNSVKSVFDPKSTYKIAAPSPKAIEGLKQHIDRAHRFPEDMANVGSTIDPRLNTAIGQSISSAVSYLKSLEPKQPQAFPFDSGVKTPPSTHNDIYNHVLKITEQPLYVLEKIKQGTLIPEEVGAVKTIYPLLYQRLQNQITEHLVEAKGKGAVIPYRTKIGLSAFLGSPMDTTMSPEAIQATQPQQQNQPPQGAQTGVQPKRSTSGLDKMATMAQTPGQARVAERSSGK